MQDEKGQHEPRTALDLRGWKASLVQGPGFWGALEGDQHFILEAYQAGQIMCKLIWDADKERSPRLCSKPSCYYCPNALRRA